MGSRYVNQSAAEEDERLAIALMLRELLRGAPDAMGAVRSDWLPLAFVGRHEPRWQSELLNPADKDEPGKLAESWREAYVEAGVGSSAASLHLHELVSLLTCLVDGPSWALRRAAAFSLIELKQ